MKPIDFNERNKILLKPRIMTNEECQPLPIFSDDTHCISKWQMSWKERLHCLFRGYIWLWVLSNGTRPPTTLKAEKTAFKEQICLKE